MKNAKKNQHNRIDIDESGISSGENVHIGNNDLQIGDNTHNSSNSNNNVGNIIKNVTHNYGSINLTGIAITVPILGVAIYFLFQFVLSPQSNQNDERNLPNNPPVVTPYSDDDDERPINSKPTPPSPKSPLFALTVSGGNSQLQQIARNYLGEQLTHQNLKFTQGQTSKNTNSLACMINVDQEVIDGLESTYLVTFRLQAALRDLKNETTLKQYNFQSKEYILDSEEEIPTKFTKWLSSIVSQFSTVKNHL